MQAMIGQDPRMLREEEDGTLATYIHDKDEGLEEFLGSRRAQGAAHRMAATRSTQLTAWLEAGAQLVLEPEAGQVQVGDEPAIRIRRATVVAAYRHAEAVQFAATRIALQHSATT